MTKEEIIKYVTSSPENTNPNVLEGMLEQLDSGGGDYKKELLIDAEVTPTGLVDAFEFNVPLDLNIEDLDMMLSTINNDNQAYIFNAIITESGIIICDNPRMGITLSTNNNTGEIYFDGEVSNIQIYKLVPASSSNNSNNSSEPVTPSEPIDEPPDEPVIEK